VTLPVALVTPLVALRVPQTPVAPEVLSSTSSPTMGLGATTGLVEPVVSTATVTFEVPPATTDFGVAVTVTVGTVAPVAVTELVLSTTAVPDAGLASPLCTAASVAVMVQNPAVVGAVYVTVATPADVVLALALLSVPHTPPVPSGVTVKSTVAVATTPVGPVTFAVTGSVLGAPEALSFRWVVAVTVTVSVTTVVTVVVPVMP